MDQLSLFEAEPVPVKTPKVPKSNGNPVYAKYRPKHPVKCDDCMLLLVQMQGMAPVARYARFSRKTAGQLRLLCAGHMHQWRERDKLPKRKGWV